MQELKIDRGAWILVCDGAKALVLENAGSRMEPNLVAREVYEQDDPKTAEIGTDRPGRSFQSVGGKRSALEQTDLHDLQEERFLAGIAQRLDVAVREGLVESLIVAAPPRALGMLRQKLTAHVRQAIRAEIDKDYVKLPTGEIARLLTA